VDIKAKIGLRTKKLRLDAGLSQEDLALKAGIDRTYINSVENGKRNVSIININKIAIALDTSLANFFNSDIF
jgi:transcriptional regulator with XRE-family HTH domain